MSVKSNRISQRTVVALVVMAGASAWVSSFSGCSTTQLTPGAIPAETAPLPPPYASVPSPAGYDISDIRELFYDKAAPKSGSLSGCDSDVLNLKSLAKSEDEFKEGVAELVLNDPVKYHWCFYQALLQLNDQLKIDVYIDEKQKHVLSAYVFLVPVARAFLTEFHDSRYLRWAVVNYRELSEWIFYRKLEISPQETSELVDAEHGFGNVRLTETKRKSVLEKYGITPSSSTNLAKEPRDQDRSPAATEAPTNASITSSEEPVTAPAPKEPPKDPKVD